MDDTRLEKCCDICGHIGYEEVIATCSKCRTSCEHGYCMRVLVMDAPQDWVCEACTSYKDLVLPGFRGKEDFMNFSDVVHHNVVIPGGSHKVCDQSAYSERKNHTKRPKEVEKRKVMFLSTEEVVRLASGAKKESSRKSDFRRRYCTSSSNSKFFSTRAKPRARTIDAGFIKPPGHSRMQLNSITNLQAPGSSEEQKIPINPAQKHRSEEQKFTSSRTAKEATHCNANVPTKEFKTCNGNVDQAVNKSSHTSSTSVHSLAITERRALEAPLGDHRCKDVSAFLPAEEVQTTYMDVDKVTIQASCAPSSSRSSPLLFSDGNSSTVAEPKNPDVQKQDPPYCPNFPSLHVIWKGGFKFFDTTTPGQFYGGFQAHPPCKLHGKAYKASMSLPTVLQVKLVPWSNVLADLFKNDYPDCHDIALYFFPSANIERSQENHDRLFKLMEIQNSVMRSYADGVELLILTSRQLQPGTEEAIARSSTYGFLWGVFRPDKTGKVLSYGRPSLVPPLKIIR